MARTWIGKSSLAVELGAVSLLPSLPRAAIPRSASSGSVVGCSPARAWGRVPCPELVAAAAMADPDEEKIPGAHPDVLCALGRFEVGDRHGVARLQPGTRPAPEGCRGGPPVPRSRRGLR